MANPEHVEILMRGYKYWNRWRKENPKTRPDLYQAKLSEFDSNSLNQSGAVFIQANFRKYDLREANLREANLVEADLSKAFINKADLSRANLSGANLFEAQLNGTIMKKANLRGAGLNNAFAIRADFSEADLRGAYLSYADLSKSDLGKADLREASLVHTKLEGANLSNCRIYGISAWNLKLTRTKQENLIVTQENEPIITVDNLEVAQFIYLLLSYDKIRNVIDTIGEKGVLILGRFTPERKAVLDAIRDKLRELGFVPMMFDFEKPTQRDFTETIKTLAGMSRFIIADITNPKSAPLELQAILPHYMIPLVPILQEDEKPFAMFRDLDQKYRQWVLPRLEYDTPDNLIKTMDKAIVNRALKLADELRVIKAQERQAEHVKDYL